MSPRELRADTPALHEDVYLNFGAHGPSPRYVVEAADEFVQSHEYETSTRNDPYEAFDTMTACGSASPPSSVRTPTRSRSRRARPRVSNALLE